MRGWHICGTVVNRTLKKSSFLGMLAVEHDFLLDLGPEWLNNVGCTTVSVATRPEAERQLALRQQIAQWKHNLGITR